MDSSRPPFNFDRQGPVAPCGLSSRETTLRQQIVRYLWVRSMRQSNAEVRVGGRHRVYVVVGSTPDDDACLDVLGHVDLETLAAMAGTP